MKSFYLLLLAGLVVGTVSAAQEIPISGNYIKNVEMIDTVMIKYLKAINCTTASICISKGDTVIVSRGYGWVDKAKTRPAPPDVMMSLASCDKPILSASIRHLASKGLLDLDDSVLEFLEIQPAGQVIDPRVYDITINHLINNKAGWGKNPISRLNVKGKNNLDNLAQIATKKLLHDPGTKADYCNFGFGLLNEVIKKASGLTSGEYFEKRLPNIKGTFNYNQAGNYEKGKSSWNAGSHGTSTPVLCQFINHYWYGGDPRKGSNLKFTKYGSWPDCTSIMLWMPERLNVAIIFNGRKKGAGNSAIKQEILSILDNVL